MADQRVKRRLAAIAVADVVGYSRLIEIEESETLAALRQRQQTTLEPIIRSHDRRIVFGLPEPASVAGVLTQ